MSFYVTLPSDSSMEIFPGNVQSDFSVYLKEPIILDREYEVALAEINYFYLIKINIGSVIIEKNNEKFEISAEVYDGEKFVDFAKRFGKEVLDKTKKKVKVIFNKELYTIFFEDRDSTENNQETESENNILENKTENKQVTTEKKDIKKSKTSETAAKIYYKGDYIKSLVVASQSKPTIRFPFENIRICDSFYVYTNIIKDQFVGDAFGKLLRNVTTNGIIGTPQTITYTNPHYLPVEQTNFQKIYISIRDNLGKRVHFDNFFTRVIVKLHFRAQRLI